MIEEIKQQQQIELAKRQKLELAWNYKPSDPNPANLSVEILTRDLALSTLQLGIWGVNEVDDYVL